jgi:excisionase family DNA binding protein
VIRSARDVLVAKREVRALFESMSEITKETTERTDGVLLLTIVEAARVLSIGRTTMYQLVGSGEIEVVHIGRAVRVPVVALQAFVTRQCRAGVVG